MEVCDEETISKFHRFKEITADPNLRECPHAMEDGSICGHSQRGDPRKPAIVCDQCGSTYCFWHASAHPGITCKQCVNDLTLLRLSC